jgi:hypothetical protein
MTRHFHCWLYLLVILSTGCGTCPTNPPKRAAQEVGPVKEPASFWVKIANDSSYSIECRRTCVFELFRRHVRAGMSLSEVAERLEQANWLPDNWIYDKGAGTGYMPVRFVLGDSVFAIGVLPAGEKNWSYVCMRVCGRVTAQQLGKALRGEAVGEYVRATKLEEIGFAEY